MLFKNNNCRGKRCRRNFFCISCEFQAATNKTYFFCVWKYVFMPFFVAGSGGDKKYNYCIRFLRFQIRFLNPLPAVSPIGRIQKCRFSFPVFFQGIFFGCIKSRAFRIRWRCRQINRKIKFPIQCFKKLLWRFPIHFLRTENCLFHIFTNIIQKISGQSAGKAAASRTFAAGCSAIRAAPS